MLSRILTYIQALFSTPEQPESAGSRVFRTAELVSLIAQDLTQPALVRVGRVNSITKAECERVLYRSPVIVSSGRVNDRLRGLTSALEGRSGQAKNLKMHHQQAIVPKIRLLKKLMPSVSGLSKLELINFEAQAVANVATGLTSIARQIEHLHLDLDNPKDSHVQSVAQLLSACISLSALHVSRFHPRNGLAQLHPTPTYHLSTIHLDHIGFFSRAQDLIWLFGQSHNTLTSLALSGFMIKILPRPLDVITAATVQLRTVHFHFTGKVWLREEVLRLAEVAACSSINSVVITLRSHSSGMSRAEWASVEQIVVDATDELDPRCKTKVKLELIPPPLIDEVDSDDSESDDGD